MKKVIHHAIKYEDFLENGCFFHESGAMHQFIVYLFDLIYLLVG